MRPDLLKFWACRAFSGLSWAYLLGLFAWLVAQRVQGDRSPMLALLNLAGLYLFLPLPLALLAAAVCRSLSLGLGVGLGAGAFLVLWGGLFLPKNIALPPTAQAAGPNLTVMTYNVLAFHNQIDSVLETLQDANADVVLIQELNQALARRLQSELLPAYPYQVLAPLNNASGIGVISKYPLSLVHTGIEHGEWLGGPQVLDLDWDGYTVRVVNFHMRPTTRPRPLERVQREFQQREDQARALAELAQQTQASGLPVVMGGDANSVPMSQVHRILSGSLQDAWQAVGHGFGHTFPGYPLPVGKREGASLHLPRWLVRIDYIFHSPGLVPLQARLARIDGASDHRGVIVTFQRNPSALEQ